MCARHVADEVKREVNLRYSEEVWGLEVDVTLEAEAPHFVFVYGEVAQTRIATSYKPDFGDSSLGRGWCIKVGWQCAHGGDLPAAPRIGAHGGHATGPAR